MSRVFIIAEAGDNHNGQIELAYKLVDAAKEAGADAVKFQTFITENVISVNAEMADYQKTNTGKVESQYDMVKKLELSFDDFRGLKKYCDKIGIKFLTTAFDEESLDFVVNDLKLDTLKIPSGEITNLPYLIKCAETHLPIILSTGMCQINEIAECLDALKKYGAHEITLLHCTTEYPTPLKEVNLRAMNALHDKFGLSVGYSDHTPGISVALLATALGASIIEKHFTLDKNMEGPDHKASLDVPELKELVKAIRQTEEVLGDGIKRPAECEIKNIAIARKSIVAKRDIAIGETLDAGNITTKRPGDGLSPMKWFDVLGSKAKKNFKKDDLIEL